MHLPLASALKVVPLPDSWVSCWLVVRCAESARAQAANTSPCISEAERQIGMELNQMTLGQEIPVTIHRSSVVSLVSTFSSLRFCGEKFSKSQDRADDACKNIWAWQEYLRKVVSGVELPPSLDVNLFVDVLG